MGQRNEELLAEARRIAPLAARRAEDTILLAKAQGCRVFDADNVAYIDYHCGGGTNLLGYGNQYVLDAVRRGTGLGLATGFHSSGEIELAELLEEVLPDLSPWVVTSGESPAWEMVLRWCRRTTGRQRIVVFDGNRRGAVETMHVAAAGPLGISQPLVAGITTDAARLVRVVPWGDTESFITVLTEVGVDTAAVILDPIAAQFGVVHPEGEFLRTVQERTRAVGALFVVDETLTGFRLARGGAMEVFGLEPDVAVFGGSLGGGISSVTAVGWRRSLKVALGDDLVPPPPPLGVLAASATLSVLRNDAVHQRLEERGQQLQSGMEALAERSGRQLRCTRVGSIFSVAFARAAVTDGSTFARVDQESWVRFARALREGGVLMPARSPAPAFLSHAHGVKDIEQTLSAMDGALKRMQREDEA